MAMPCWLKMAYCQKDAEYKAKQDSAIYKQEMIAYKCSLCHKWHLMKKKKAKSRWY